MNEAHVEHAVGLVEHAAAHLAQVEELLLREIEQPPWSGHQQVAPSAQRLDLRLLTHATEDHDGAQPGMAAVVAGTLGDLCRELARRRQHQRARGACLVRCKVLQDRQNERGGLAGAGLRTGQHIAAGEHRGYRLALNGCGGDVALFGHSTGQLGLQPEIGK